MADDRKWTKGMSFEGQPSLVVEYKNQASVELLTLTTSLSAFGQEFKRFIANEPSAPAEIQLYVDHIRRGSIIAELIPALEHIDFMLQHREVIGGFMTHWHDVLHAILKLKPEAKQLSTPSIKAARDFVQVTANDGGSQTNIFMNDNSITVNNFNMTQNQAAAIDRNANHILGHQLPEEKRFTNEPMTLFQMRDAPSGTAGDKGYIDQFSGNPIKLTFANEETKHAILHHQANPFDHIFFVDGVVKTSGGKVVAYHIVRLQSAYP